MSGIKLQHKFTKIPGAPNPNTSDKLKFKVLEPAKKAISADCPWRGCRCDQTGVNSLPKTSASTKTKASQFQVLEPAKKAVSADCPWRGCRCDQTGVNSLLKSES